MAANNDLLRTLQGLVGRNWSEGEVVALDQLGDAENHIFNKVVEMIIMKGYFASFVDADYQSSVRNAAAVRAPPTLSVVCPRCDLPVNLPPPEDRWYCVSAGLRVGWVKTWNTVKSLVLHVSGNKYTSYATKEDARKAFVAALIGGTVQVLGSTDRALEYDPIPFEDGCLFP
ncbi:hypothetical protein VNI00_009266 [Paramarasmius palmivorus]|uniref:Ribonuclease H1 N-terminal domain-containing protein n=1 Tax=Paramarasmius palmivorus TaxID=297713 RepID=A0AAW0CTX6_9AGAR